MPVALRDDCHTICGLVTRMLRHVEPLRHPQFDICKQRNLPIVETAGLHCRAGGCSKGQPLSVAPPARHRASLQSEPL
jgi:predicted RNA-binding protein with PUA domain